MEGRAVMAGSRAVQARVRLAKRLKEQQAALAAAARCQDGVDSAVARAEELAAQGASLVAVAEKALAASITQLVGVMGSAALAAAVLDIDERVVRKALAAKPAGRAAVARNGVRPDGGAAGPIAGPRPPDEAQAS